METLVQPVALLEFDQCCLSNDLNPIYPKSLSPSLPQRVRSVSEGKNDLDLRREVTVNGADHGDIPMIYTVKDLKTTELPVIGTYVDPEIIPGFEYRIRILGSEQYLFDGKAVTLKSVGFGYGKRITTSAGHFYSDTHGLGLGFSLQGGLTGGDNLQVYNTDGRHIGTAVVERIYSKQEIIPDSNDCQGEDITKHLMVTWEGVLNFAACQHGVRPLASHMFLELTCNISLVKSRGKSIRKTIEPITLPGFGVCTLG